MIECLVSAIIPYLVGCEEFETGVAFPMGHYYTAAMVWPWHKKIRAIRKGFSSSEHLKAYDCAGLVRIAEEVLRVLKHYGMFMEVCALIMCSTTNTEFYDWVDATFVSFRTFFVSVRGGMKLSGIMTSGYNIYDYFKCHRDNKILMDWVFAHDESLKRDSEHKEHGWFCPITPKSRTAEARKAAKCRKHLLSVPTSFGHIMKSEITIEWYTHIRPALYGNNRDFLREVFSSGVPLNLTEGELRNMVFFGDMVTTIIAIDGGYYPIKQALHDVLACRHMNTDYYYIDWVWMVHIILDYIQERGITFDESDQDEYFYGSLTLDNLGPSESHQRLVSRLTDPSHPGYIKNMIDLDLYNAVKAADERKDRENEEVTCDSTIYPDQMSFDELNVHSALKKVKEVNDQTDKDGICSISWSFCRQKYAMFPETTPSSKINLACSDFPIDSIEKKYGKRKEDRIHILELSHALIRGSCMTESEKKQVIDIIQRTERRDCLEKFFNQARLSLNICGVTDEVRHMVAEGELDPLETLHHIARVSLNTDAEELIKLPMKEAYISYPGDMYSEFLEFEHGCVNLLAERLLSILGNEPPKYEHYYSFKLTKSHIYGSAPSSVFTSFDIIKANWLATQILYKDKPVPEWDEIQELIPEHPEYKFFRTWMLRSKLVRQKVISKVGKKLGIAATIENVIMDLLHDFMRSQSMCSLTTFAIFRDEVIYEGDVLDRWDQNDPTHKYMRANRIEILAHDPLGTFISVNGKREMKCHDTNAISKAVIKQMCKPKCEPNAKR